MAQKGAQEQKAAGKLTPKREYLQRTVIRTQAVPSWIMSRLPVICALHRDMSGNYG